MREIYFDNAATTPALKPVMDEVVEERSCPKYMLPETVTIGNHGSLIYNK